MVPFQLLSYEEQDEYGHSVYITCDSTQIDDSQQSSSVSNFFFLFTIVPWCLFALFIFRDFAKKVTEDFKIVYDLFYWHLAHGKSIYHAAQEKEEQ